MRRNETHSHRCTTCSQSFDCGGLLSQNHDGHPAVVCAVYHECGETECAACFVAEKCAWCGKPGELVTDGDGDRIHALCAVEQRRLDDEKAATVTA